MKRKPEKESIDMEEGDSSDSTSSEVEEYSEEEGTSEATELTKDKSVGRKKAKSSLPTKDEQLQLNNTDSLLRSNLLKLQIDEMLGEVSCEAVLNKKKVQNSIKGGDEVNRVVREWTDHKGNLDYMSYDDFYKKFNL